MHYLENITERNRPLGSVPKRASFVRWTMMLAMSFVVVSSCRKEEKLDDVNPVDLGGETWVPTAIDQWLRDSLTVPYNISVKYRWDPWELNLDKTLTPPDESKIVPAMSAIKRVWIDPYNLETGSDLFIKRYSPKQFKLVGSVEYNYNGTVLLGQAEGGNNIAFFDINQNFDKDNASSIMRMIQTSHHEFAHVLHQNILYPPEFKGISASLGLDGYTATWFNIFPDEALEEGYITPYSMASFDEDFVEMIANMLMFGRVRFDEIVSTVNPTAQQALRTKEQFVVNYFREVWNIDFYGLQTKVQTALNNLVAPPTVSQSFGHDKTYTTASVNPDNQTLLPQRVSFMSIYNSSANAVEAIPGFGLVMDSMAVIMTDASSATLRMYVNQNGVTFLADFAYAVSVSGGTYSFTYVGENANGAIIKDAVTPLLNYFSGNQFNISWYADPSVSIFPRVRFAPVASPTNYFLALLLP